MPDRSIMSRQEAFDYVHRFGQAVMTGSPLPDVPEVALMYSSDALDAVDAFTRSLAARWDEIPSQASNNFQIQEALRFQLDQVIGDVAIGMRKALRRVQAEE